MRLISSLCIALIAASAANAAVYYVATTGLDTNAGTSALPWATLQKAVDTIKPGDTAFVMPGTYAGFRIENSGTAALPKTIRAMATLSAMVNRPGPRNKHTSNIEMEDFSVTTGYWIIDGFDVYASPKYGIDLRHTTTVQVRNCRTRNSKLTGIFTAFSDHVVIQTNESASNGEHGIYTSNSGDYPTIRSNRIHHNYAAGIHMNGDVTAGGDGEISFAVVEKNTIYENGKGGGSAINCDGVEDSIFRNNLIYNNHASGISLYAGDAARGSSRNKVYNNTLVMPSDARWAINIPPSAAGKPNPTDNHIFNNIIYSAHTWRGAISIYSPTAPGFESDYNTVVTYFSIDNAGNHIPLSTWQSYGFDRHSRIATPDQLFVNAAAFDFRLKAGSPAINQGTSLDLDVPTDIVNVARPQLGSFDIGAYESQTP